MASPFPGLFFFETKPSGSHTIGQGKICDLHPGFTGFTHAGHLLK
jgi:hypothetical protein